MSTTENVNFIIMREIVKIFSQRKTLSLMVLEGSLNSQGIDHTTLS